MHSKPKAKRGDIYWVDLPKSQSEGTEQHNRRPCVILSSDAINKDDSIKGYIIAPLTTTVSKANPYFRIKCQVQLKGQSPKEAVVLVEQIRFISKERLDSQRVGTLDNITLAAIEAGLKYVLYMP